MENKRFLIKKIAWGGALVGSFLLLMFTDSISGVNLFGLIHSNVDPEKLNVSIAPDANEDSNNVELIRTSVKRIPNAHSDTGDKLGSIVLSPLVSPVSPIVSPVITPEPGVSPQPSVQPARTSDPTPTPTPRPSQLNKTGKVVINEIALA